MIRSWDEDDLDDAFAELRELPKPSPDLTNRIMEQVRDQQIDPPRSLRRSHIGMMCAVLVAGIAVLAIIIPQQEQHERIYEYSYDTEPSSDVRRVANATNEPQRMTRFVLVAPDAHSVALVGSFNDWRTDATPLRRSGPDGVWMVDVPLQTGRYTYLFVVDGHQWVPDPAAPTDAIAEFGQSNSVVTVVAPGPL